LYAQVGEDGVRKRKRGRDKRGEEFVFLCNCADRALARTHVTCDCDESG
jgi:hypothetical protein